jgi:hypothetical protein
MANLIGYGSELGTGQGIRLCEIEPDNTLRIVLAVGDVAAIQGV